MIILFYITVGLLIIYFVLIRYYHISWNSIPTFRISEPAYKEQLKVSVIIPARNEEDNIVHCLRSLSSQSYPKALTEIIVINDYSTDRTAERVRTFPASNIKLINLSDRLNGTSINSYKKKAIETAIGAALGELIITTDADCTAPPGWIKHLAACYAVNKPALIAAPVRIVTNHSLLSIFQSIDFLTLQGITGASVHKKFHAMCNGANLAYQRKAFYEVNGFDNIDKKASGDDMMLMHKIVKKYPEGSFFIKAQAAIVSTQPALTWKAFLHQRIRWASKAGNYGDKRITAVLLLVYLLNLFILVFLIAGMWNVMWILIFLLLVVSKTVIEYPFVRTVASFFKQQALMAYFPLLQPLHIFYTVVAGWLGIFGTYEWKSRKVR